MATEFKHLEALPLDEDNLIINDSPESNLQAKACLNLGFNALNSNIRFSNILDINNKILELEAPNFLNLSHGLESLLITSLNLNSISNIVFSQVSPHYIKRQANISRNKILPSFGYCQNLTFTKFKIWGGLYGTLSYYNYLLEEYNEYATPSQITYDSAKSLLQYSKQVVFTSSISEVNNNNLLLTFYEQALNLLDDPSLEADKQIYDLSKNIILIHPLTRSLFNELNFYESWLKRVFQWKDTYYNSTQTESLDSNKQRAIECLLSCVQITQQYGLNNDLINNLSADFIHQSYSSNIKDLISDLATERNQCTYIKIDSVKTEDPAELLVIEFLDNISKFRNNYDFNNTCNLIQEFYCPPGGYSLLLITLATCLINRAYIISYNNINNTQGDIYISDDYKRIVKLIGLAAILLIKTSNPTASIVGENLLVTFGIYINNLDPNNLLDIYN
jgi:hypothetical protein